MEKFTKEDRKDASKRQAYRRYLFRRIGLAIVCVLAIGLMLLSVFYGWIPKK